MRWQRPMNATTVQAVEHVNALTRYGGSSLTEHYAGATVQIPGGSIELGLSRSPGDPITAARAAARRICEEHALVLNGDDVSDQTAGPLSDAIAEQFAKAWPDRAWWIEIWQAEERLTQVYHRWPWPGDRP